MRFASQLGSCSGWGGAGAGCQADFLTGWNVQELQNMQNMQELEDLQNMQNQIYQTQTSKENLETKLNLANQACKTKPTKPNQRSKRLWLETVWVVCLKTLSVVCIKSWNAPKRKGWPDVGQGGSGRHAREGFRGRILPDRLLTERHSNEISFVLETQPCWKSNFYFPTEKFS